MVYYFHTSHRNYLLLLTNPGDCTKQGEMSKGVAEKVLKFVSEDACKSLVVYSELSTPRTGDVVQ